MRINDLLAALCDELAEGDVAEPLGASCTLALVWLDLCRLAGEEPPAFLLALIAGPALVAA
jgi:hypothetical protein